MAETDRSAAEDVEDRADPLERLAASARGWHQIQLAVLGFIGFCGILWDGDSVAEFPVVRWLAVVLVALALAVALLATFMVGRVAYPFEDPARAGEMARGPTMASRSRRLVTGIRATYVAVALLVTATLSGWLPASPGNGAVVVGVATGQTWCGQLLEAPPGEARVGTTDGPVTIPLDRVLLLRPVEEC